MTGLLADQVNSVFEETVSTSFHRLSYVLLETDVFVVETSHHHLYIDVTELAEMQGNLVVIGQSDERVREAKEMHFQILENLCL